MAHQAVAAGEDWITPLGHNGRVWIVPEFKLVYVSVAKNACTAIKWVIADLAREDVNTFVSGLRAEPTDESVVHGRSLFKNVPFPDEIDPAMRSEIHPDNGWFTFAIARDPRSRFFSAWQDKLLMQNPGYRRYRGEPWYPTVPRDATEIISAFARFVDAASSPEGIDLLSKDTHFRRQVNLLKLDKIPYSHVYQIEEFSTLRADLERHLAPLGWSEPVRFRQSNHTPLRANGAAYPDDVRRKVESIYAADFKEFGSHWDFSRIATAPEWSAATVRETQVRGELGLRLGEVRDIALYYRREAKRANHRAARLEKQLSTAGLGEQQWGRRARRAARGLLSWSGAGRDRAKSVRS